MDGREGMSFSGGSAPYYMHRGGGVSGSGTPSGGFQPPSGFRALSNVSLSPGSTFKIESHSQPQHGSFSSHGINIGSSPDGGGVPCSGEPVKKKRGRPRKYGPDGSVSLMLSPMSASANSTPGSLTSSDKRPRGRPPGTGRKQQLATLGEWMNSSAGLAFSPHVITVGVQEDIVAKLLSFAQQRPRAVCILTGTGTVSSVTLRQPASTSVSVTYEGRFQILCLSGSYLVAEEGGPHNRTGGMSVSLSSPDGHIIGGGVTRLIAASPVQVVACSFVYGGSKPKTKQVTTTTTKDSSSEPSSDNKLASAGSDHPPNNNQNYTCSSSPAPPIWPAPSRPVEMKSGHHPHTGIDLTRG